VNEGRGAPPAARVAALPDAGAGSAGAGCQRLAAPGRSRLYQPCRRLSARRASTKTEHTDQLALLASSHTPLGARHPLARTSARSLRRQLAQRRRARRGGRARRAVGRSGAARRARALQDRVHLRRRRVHAALPLGLVLRGQGAAQLGASRCSTSDASSARGRLRYGAKPFCGCARMLIMPMAPPLGLRRAQRANWLDTTQACAPDAGCRADPVPAAQAPHQADRAPQGLPELHAPGAAPRPAPARASCCLAERTSHLFPGGRHLRPRKVWRARASWRLAAGGVRSSRMQPPRGVLGCVHRGPARGRGARCAPPRGSRRAQCGAAAADRAHRAARPAGSSARAPSARSPCAGRCRPAQAQQIQHRVSITRAAGAHGRATPACGHASSVPEQTARLPALPTATAAAPHRSQQPGKVLAARSGQDSGRA